MNNQKLFQMSLNCIYKCTNDWVIFFCCQSMCILQSISQFKHLNFKTLWLCLISSRFYRSCVIKMMHARHFSTSSVHNFRAINVCCKIKRSRFVLCKNLDQFINLLVVYCSCHWQENYPWLLQRPCLHVLVIKGMTRYHFEI